MAPGLDLPASAASGEHEYTIDKPKLYMLDKFHPDAVKYAHALFNVILPTDPEIQQWQAQAEYVVIKGSSLSADAINSAQKLRAVGKQGVGLDRIDVEACAKRGIEVFNTPGVNATAVAELVLALTMSVARQIGSIQVRQAGGESVHKETCSGLILTNKTLGLIGMGNIGKAVARVFQGAFAANVVAYDPYLPEGVWGDVPHTRAASVEEVLRTADVLSIHVPLTASTRGLIGYKEMATMKRTAIIINAARGGIVDEDDLAAALSAGVVWGAGLDCHEEEPPTRLRYAKLWATERVISTPHIGAATAQTQLETAKAAIDRMYAFAVKGT